MATLDDAVLGPLNLLRSEGGIEVAARPAFFVTRLGVREGVTVADSADQVGARCGGVGASRGGGALRSRLFEATTRLWCTSSSLAARSADDRPHERRLLEQHRSTRSADLRRCATASAGFDRLGPAPRPCGREHRSGRGRRGLVEGGTIAEAVPVGRYRGAWSSRYLGLGVEGGARLRGERGQVLVDERAWVSKMAGTSRSRRPGGGCRAAIRARPGGPTAEEPSGGWLSNEGWTGAAEIAGQLTRSVAARFAQKRI